MPKLHLIFAVLLWALLVWLPARAYFPSPPRVAAAVAEANREAGRPRVLEVGVALYRGSTQEPVATGELLSAPAGLSRLELRSPRGDMERHLLRGKKILASRDRRALAAPRPFLPPFFLLQAASGKALTASLLTLGVSAHEVALGYEGEHDCYVLGGRASSSSRAAALSVRPALWVDQESLELVRFDRGDGVRFRLGPSADFGSVRLPSWIEASDLHGFVGRLEVLGAREVSAPPESFHPGWLGAP
jgi:hypothetical protein